MRVSGGGARGVPLTVPRGDAVRPATDSLRQAVFSALAARVPGSRFLDLFAGSGAYGLEALSRGATGGVFVEKDRQALECLRRNLAAVAKSLKREPNEGIEILPMDAAAAPLGAGPRPDLVFIDPPYDLIAEVAPRLFTRLGEALGQEALVIFEAPGRTELSPPGWTCLRRLGQGGRQPTASIFTPTPAGS